jgi:hypothetical protein
MSYWPIAKFDLKSERYEDIKQYIALFNQSDLNTIPKPYRFRIFTPYVARLVPTLPVIIKNTFRIDNDREILLRFGFVNTLGMASTAYLLFIFLIKLNYNKYKSLIGSLIYLGCFYSINWTVLPLVDAWAHAFLMLGIVAVYKKWNLALLFTMIVGMFAKETTALVVLTIPMFSRNTKLIRNQFLLALPGLLGYFLFRSVFFNSPIGYSYSFIHIMHHFWQFITIDLIKIRVLTDLFVVYGPFYLLAYWGLRKVITEKNVTARFSLFALIPLLAILTLDVDYARIYFYSFPAIIPLIVSGLDNLLFSQDT